LSLPSGTFLPLTESLGNTGTARKDAEMEVEQRGENTLTWTKIALIVYVTVQVEDGDGEYGRRS
jgi:hypothetical protein